MKFVVNTTSEHGWPKLREALLSCGCDENAAQFDWEQIKAKPKGQINPQTKAKPARNYFDLQRALNAELPLSNPSGRPQLAVVWENADRFIPGNVSVTIHRS